MLSPTEYKQSINYMSLEYMLFVLPISELMIFIRSEFPESAHSINQRNKQQMVTMEEIL
jgi:hypothetical protein